MFESLTYKRKNKYLILIAILLFIVIYFISIKRTILIYGEYKKNVELLEVAANAPLLATELQKELDLINYKLGSQTKSDEEYSDKLIELITNYCQSNNSILKEFPKTEIAHKDDLLIETNRFTLSGDFKTILKFVYLLEQKYKLGKVTSVNYVSKKDFKSNTNFLIATIYLQNIKKSNDEK